MFSYFTPYDAKNFRHIFNYPDIPKQSDFEETDNDIEHIKYKLDETKKLKKDPIKTGKTKKDLKNKKSKIKQHK